MSDTSPTRSRFSHVIRGAHAKVPGYDWFESTLVVLVARKLAETLKPGRLSYKACGKTRQKENPEKAVIGGKKGRCPSVRRHCPRHVQIATNRRAGAHPKTVCNRHRHQTLSSDLLHSSPSPYPPSPLAAMLSKRVIALARGRAVLSRSATVSPIALSRGWCVLPACSHHHDALTACSPTMPVLHFYSCSGISLLHTRDAQNSTPRIFCRVRHSVKLSAAWLTLSSLAYSCLFAINDARPRLARTARCNEFTDYLQPRL